jgi:N-acetylglucosamine malate deacetylase 2
MKYLFLLAHPDDEVVASGGTIRRLVNQGDEVRVVMATKGDAGGIRPLKSVKGSADSGVFTPEKLVRVRRQELERSCQILGINSFKFLDYEDGEINNNLVWGKLELDLIDEIEKYKPEVVVTFDHSGWYFHLDHVGVSLASLRAVQRSKHKVEAMFFSLFRPPGIKIRWQYVYQKKMPVTHEVLIKSVLKEKARAVAAHKSQKLSFLPLLKLGRMNKEFFQLVLASRKGKKIFGKHDILRKI